MLALFPNERPEYPHTPSGPSRKLSSLNSQLSTLTATSRLAYGSTYAQATTTLHHNNTASCGTARVSLAKLTDKLTTDRLLQRIIKQSFYRASVKTLITPPVWGSLTGIRPTKIIDPMLESGASTDSAARKLMRGYYVSSDRARLCADIAQSTLSLKRSLNPGDIALYIGIPFCPTRCAYCSFVSNSVEKSFSLIGQYIHTLLSEIAEASQWVQKQKLRIITIYIGGGTPTVLPPETLNTLMKALKTSFDLSHLQEYTVEAGRPDTITEEKLRIIKESGAQRVCVNPQSMSENVLAAIGRSHTPEDILRAANLVKSIGLTLNMDIIAGLPADTPEGFSKTLDKIITLMPENITVHTLSQKKGSRIMLEGTKLPESQKVAEMLLYASEALKKHGYRPYYLYRQKFTSGGFENIGWSHIGYENIYNKLMMEDLSTVLALGAGGVTKLVLPNGRIERIFNAKFPKEYISQKTKHH